MLSMSLLLPMHAALPKAHSMIRNLPFIVLSVWCIFAMLACPADTIARESLPSPADPSMYLVMHKELQETASLSEDVPPPLTWRVSLLASPPSPPTRSSTPAFSPSLLRDLLPPRTLTSALAWNTPQGTITVTASFLPEHNLASLHATPIFERVPVDFTDPDLRLLYATTLSVLPVLAWAATLGEDPEAALHFTPRRFAAPFFATRVEDTSPAALDSIRTERAFRKLAIAQVHRSAADTLQYDVYAGIATNDQNSTLLTGARVGYTFGHDVWSFGILYGHGLAEQHNLFAGRTQEDAAAESTYRIVGLDVLYDNGRFSLEQRIAYGVYGDETRRFTFFSQPALRLTQEWTVFYRLDHLSLGQGMPKSTDHVVGMKLTPIARLFVRAEWSVHNADSAAEDGWGFRLLGTLRF